MTPETFYVCSICGDTTEENPESDSFLVYPKIGARNGEMVVRCPMHITEYAIRRAGGTIFEGEGLVNHYRYPLVRRTTV